MMKFIFFVAICCLATALGSPPYSTDVEESNVNDLLKENLHDEADNDVDDGMLNDDDDVMSDEDDNNDDDDDDGDDDEVSLDDNDYQTEENVGPADELFDLENRYRQTKKESNNEISQKKDVPKKVVVKNEPKKVVVKDEPKKVVVKHEPKKVVVKDEPKKVVVKDEPKTIVVKNEHKKTVITQTDVKKDEEQKDSLLTAKLDARRKKCNKNCFYVRRKYYLPKRKVCHYTTGCYTRHIKHTKRFVGWRRRRRSRLSFYRRRHGLVFGRRRRSN